MSADEERDQSMVEITARLRPVCPTMPDEEFRAMVERIATVTLKYREFDRPGATGRP